MTAALGGVLSSEEKEQFNRAGYLVVRGIFKQEIEQMKNIFMGLHAAGPVPGYFNPVPANQAGGDILKQYPRIMHPHRYNEAAMNYMIDFKVMNVLADLYAEEPIACQSMFYFKPPGAKGQALHQDNFYLKIEPGTCLAAWTAVDDADAENGGLFVVPGSHKIDILCPHRADPKVSFTREEVDVPEGLEAIPVSLKAGDVLFFNGNVIHGSYPNTSTDRFRRAFICHYAANSTALASSHYNPMYTYDGKAIIIDSNTASGPCGNEFETKEVH